jgi:hypothetical protein
MAWLENAAIASMTMPRVGLGGECGEEDTALQEHGMTRADKAVPLTASGGAGFLPRNHAVTGNSAKPGGQAPFGPTYIAK